MKNLILVKFLLVISFVFSNFVFAHEGHDHKTNDEYVISVSSIQTNEINANDPRDLIDWIGNFHFLFLHFPIALIIMVGIAEVLFRSKQALIYNEAARFMLIAALFTTIPTVLFGYALGYGASYNGIEYTFYIWHMWLGITLLILTFIAVYLREYTNRYREYCVVLSSMILILFITGYLGGYLTLGEQLVY